MKARKKSKLKPALSIFSSGSESSKAKPKVGVAGKKYGLVKPQQLKKPLGIFSTEDSDEEEEAKPTDYNLLKYRKQKVKQQRREALAQDPTVFQYDEVFDDIQQKRADKAQEIKKEKRQRKSRYIGNLVKKAKEREIEQAIVEERVLLREREKDDDMYGDKDKYVTSAYKKALKERELWQKERDRLDAIDDAKMEERKKGGAFGPGLMSHLLNRRSTQEEEKETQTIRERVQKALDEREKQEKAAREKRKAEKRKKLEAQKSKKSLEAIAKAAVSRYNSLEKDDQAQAAKTLVHEMRKDQEGPAAKKQKTEEAAKHPSKDQIIHKRNTGEKLMSAKERYLERKRKQKLLAEKLGKA
uniref:Nuclear speckle splicing regulatory protein 1 N-terminal domain-containing protein n=1 Tax=Lotharella oceanica TaxID=641309 RepID=A0A7S2TNH1_9EUKA